MDLAGPQLFLRNLRVETATVPDPFPNMFHEVPIWAANCETLTTVSRHAIWADYDRDGDLDCALSKHQSETTYNLLRNDLYICDSEACSGSYKRFVKVRPVKLATAENGQLDRDYTENEFGARAEIFINDDSDGDVRRTQLTSSSEGYLSQSEYILHFGLPADPDPDPEIDLTFSVSVTFPTRQDQPMIRVDGWTTPCLSDISLTSLYNTYREITVYRDGHASINGDTKLAMTGNVDRRLMWM